MFSGRLLLVGLACLSLVACGGGGGGGGGGSPPTTTVTVSGRITFERVPFAARLGDGLDFTATLEVPAREIEVELLRVSNGTVLATATTDVSGNYSLTAPGATDVFLRAKALSRHVATASRPAAWDLRVLNNTNGNALYVLDSNSFNTGSSNQTRNLKAATGWGADAIGYTGTRAAAPFAVLDTLYAAMQFVIAQGDASLKLSPLSAYWSDRNVPTEGDFSIGQINTTSYIPPGTSGVASGIYVLGAATVDTDEFDQHVIAHEFQHFLEDAISRTDTPGGDHALDERLDMRVAFSEGYANAFCAMVLADPVYRDSFVTTVQGTSLLVDFHFNLESRQASTPGWYNETSVQRIVWDLFDAANDDAVSVGYGPIHSVLTAELKDGVPLTSLFAFVTALKQRPGVPAALVDQLVEAEMSPTDPNLGIVSSAMNAYATTETHSGVAPSSSSLVLPIYTSIALNGSARLCTSSSVNISDNPPVSLAGSYNKLGNRRFLRFSVPSARTIRISVNCNAADPDCGGAIVPDPDFILSRAADIRVSESETPRLEQLDVSATAGDYVLEIYEWSHIDPQATTRRGLTCMTVNITG